MIYNYEMRFFTLAILLIAIAIPAFAGDPVPEIDPASGTAAVALLSGCMLVIRASRRKR